MVNLLMESWALLEAICIPCLILGALSAIFLIVVVMIQPSNSSGISALGGQQETFYGKNKGKTLESKLRKLTVIMMAVMAVFMITFCVVVFHFNGF
ncbi:MAG: preprotein translocase subunit SecG [Clostridia bacterium]|nr:preprotein translocase subunit SecG [Clostridia bacterium]MBR1676797.1 preprotein translocase subunit SecG [Clostridia bacterium]